MPDTTPKFLFKIERNTFYWKDIKTYLVRSQYNELLKYVVERNKILYPGAKPTFLNPNYCLAIGECSDGKNTGDKANDTLMKRDAGKAELSPLEHAQNKSQLAQIALKSYYLTASLNNTPPDGGAVNKLERAVKDSETELERLIVNTSHNIVNECYDVENNYFCAPAFRYERTIAVEGAVYPAAHLDPLLKTNGLTVGALLWLYYYERMGIFQILSKLMGDYNYTGQYTISGNRTDKNGAANKYSTLMDMICSMHRIGICSNLRDRICTYQRVLGVTIENNLGIDSEKNTGFMQTFNKLIGHMLEYYKTKQLAQAIQSQSGATPPRSSVATQTSIRDTMNVMKQQFEPMQYGRNQINTFLGISIVQAAICLISLVKTEIGIPDQYEKPEEFIPAAYDILVAKRPVTLNETNRFIVYDNCASYGYRLLTDLETIDLERLTFVATGSSLDVWLNDIEGLVEGYKNASTSIPEGVASIV